MHVSSRNEHRVMEAVSGKSGMAKGKQPACANGDGSVHRVNSVPKGGEEAVKPVPKRADAGRLARGNSSDGGLDLD